MVLNEVLLDVFIIVVIVGEEFGDQFGGDLLVVLCQCYLWVCFIGIGGKCMQVQGLESWYDMVELLLFGLVEVLCYLFCLFRLCKEFIVCLIIV